MRSTTNVLVLGARASWDGRSIERSNGGPPENAAKHLHLSFQILIERIALAWILFVVVANQLEAAPVEAFQKLHP